MKRIIFSTIFVLVVSFVSLGQADESNSELTTLKVIFKGNNSETSPVNNGITEINGENLSQAMNTIFKKN
jgi:hypothetical protein